MANVQVVTRGAAGGGVGGDYVVQVGAGTTTTDPTYSGEFAAVHVASTVGSDSVDLTSPCRGISFGGAGTLKITTLGGETISFASGDLATGTIHPISAKRIFLTGTSATGLWIYW